MEGLHKTIPCIMSQHQGVSTIRQLLVDFHGMDCEVVHDKVYSLLSLASDGGMIPVDYSCPPQELLCRVLTRSGWSHDDLQLLAMDICMPTRVPNTFRNLEALKDFQQYTELEMEEKLVVTHQIRVCSMPLSLKKGEWVKWTSFIEAWSKEPCQQVTKIDDFGFLRKLFPKELVGSEEPCRPDIYWDHRNCGEEKFRIKRRRHPNDLRARLVTCNDGTMALACASARVGDLLCDLIAGKKMVVREDHENKPCLIGTALLGASPTFTALMYNAQQVLELALEEQHHHDFLQLDCSTDGSTIADYLLATERTFKSSQIQILSDFISVLGAQLAKPRCRERTRVFPKQHINGFFKIWDLVALAESQSELISIKGSDSDTADGKTSSGCKSCFLENQSQSPQIHQFERGKLITELIAIS
jgi:hypothetical protein